MDSCHWPGPVLTVADTCEEYQGLENHSNKWKHKTMSLFPSLGGGRRFSLENQIYRGQKDLPCTDSLPKWLQQLWPGKVKARSWELHTGLLQRWQVPKCLIHLCWPSRHWDLKWELDWNQNTWDWTNANIWDGGTTRSNPLHTFSICFIQSLFYHLFC